MFSNCMKTYTNSLPTKQHIDVCILCDQYILLILYTGSNLLNLVDFFFTEQSDCERGEWSVRKGCELLQQVIV